MNPRDVAAGGFVQPWGPRRSGRRRLCAITTLFNPQGYHSLAHNYRRFAAHLAAHDVALLTAELLYPGQEPTLRGQGVRHFRAEAVMWHKERLLNLLLPHLPIDCELVAWIDADVIFANDAWVEETARALDSAPVAQLFEKAILLDAQGNHYRDAYGFAFSLVNGFTRNQDGNARHPGFAWAARREVLDAWGGLYDRHILGGGDYQMALGVIGDTSSEWYSRFAPTFRAHMRSWAQRCHRITRGQIAYVPGCLMHLWHGHFEDRRYVERSRCLVDHDFDPNRDIAAGRDGLWVWDSNKPALHEAVNAYFGQRNDDQGYPVHPTRYEDKVPVLIDADGGPVAFERVLRRLATQDRRDFVAHVACHDWAQLAKVKPVARSYPWPFEIRLKGQYAAAGVPRRLQLAKAVSRGSNAERFIFVDKDTPIAPDHLRTCLESNALLLTPQGRVAASDFVLIADDEAQRPGGEPSEERRLIAVARRRKVPVVTAPRGS